PGGRIWTPIGGCDGARYARHLVRRGALAEVAGGAALLVNPLSIADIGAAMRRVAEDDALCARLDAAGRVRARSFAASAIAPRLARVYADLVALRNATPYRPA
ncbi:MAG: hypothetical protein JWN59_394, partial [Sphingomonas bacterium]|nr:hypothetical protein [Sphingomonas bacterium]